MMQNIMKAWVFGVLLFQTGSVSAQNNLDLHTQVKQLRNQLSSSFEQIDEGSVQGSTWMSANAFDKIIRSLDPSSISFEHVDTSVPSQGGTPQPAPGVVPIKAVDFIGCSVVVGTPQNSIEAELEVKRAATSWHASQPSNITPLAVSVPAKFKFLGAVRFYTQGILCQNLQVATSQIIITVSDQIQLSGALYLDDANRLKYVISYNGPTELNGNYAVSGLPIVALSSGQFTLSVPPRTLVEERLGSIFTYEGKTEIGSTLQHYDLAVSAREIEPLSDGIRIVYQINLKWRPE